MMAYRLAHFKQTICFFLIFSLLFSFFHAESMENQEQPQFMSFFTTPLASIHEWMNSERTQATITFLKKALNEDEDSEQENENIGTFFLLLEIYTVMGIDF